MSEELDPWSREHWSEGGGDPLLFYVVFGDVKPKQSLSRSTYRSNGIPDGLELMGYGPDQHEVVDGFRDGYVWEQLLAGDPVTGQRIAAATHCMVCRGTPADSSSLDYLRDTIGLLTYLLDQGGVGIYDPLGLCYWRPEDWKAEIFGGPPDEMRRHVVILLSDEDDSSLAWYHTRGMRKFGRPDISVHNVPASHEHAVTKLCNRLIEFQAAGAVIPNGQRVRMAELPDGGVMTHGGDLDDPDFNNVHLNVNLEL